MKIVTKLLIMIFAVFVTGCMQNFKESELKIKNSSVTGVTFKMNAIDVDLAPNESRTLTSDDFRPDEYAYSTVFSTAGISDTIAIEGGNGLSGTIDFTSRGKSVSIEYISDVRYETIVPKDTTKQEYDKLIFTINAVKSEGWTD